MLSVAPVRSENAGVVAALSRERGSASFPLSAISSELIIAADGDRAGPARGADSWPIAPLGVGHRVRILQAPDGCDWNDVVRDAANA